MSVHNGARYLREAVSSILNQTEKEFEFIIVDDASTDESESIIHSFGDHELFREKSRLQETHIEWTRLGIFSGGTRDYCRG